MNDQVVTVNLVPGLSAPAVVRVSQYDYGRPIVFNILDGTKAAIIGSSATITVVGTKPSGLGFSETALTISGGAVTLNTTSAMTQESGLIPAEIRIEQQGSGNVGTANFILAVEKTPHADGTTDGTQETMQNLETRLQGEIDSLDTRVTALEAGGGGSGLTDDVKTALLNCFAHVAWVDADGQDYYDALESALDSGDLSVSLMLSQVSSSNTATTVGYGESYNTTLTASTGYTLNTVTVNMGGVDVTSTTYSSGTVSIPSVTGNIVITATAVLAAQSITAVYTQSGTVYDTDTLDSLKPDLVVTANYSGGTSETIPASDYTLSGTLTVGTSTITVNYTGLTTTFNVTVTHKEITYLSNWDFTQSLTDSVSSQTVTLSAGTGYNAPERTSAGIVFSEPTQVAFFGNKTGYQLAGKTLEYDVASVTFAGNDSYHIRQLVLSNGTSSSNYGLSPLCYRAGLGWAGYSFSASSGTKRAWSSYWEGLEGTTSAIKNFMSGKTLKFVFGTDGTVTMYLDNVLIGTKSNLYFDSRCAYLYFGGNGGKSQSSGDQCYNLTLSGLRIYNNE